MTPAQLRGRFGEDAAVRYLKRQRFRIRARNLRYEGHEEIDIIAEDRDTRRYIEVKTRRQRPDLPSRYGPPGAAVTSEKRRHLTSTARIYERRHPTKKAVQADVIEVYLDPSREEPILLSLRHIPDAFRP